MDADGRVRTLVLKVRLSRRELDLLERAAREQEAFSPQPVSTWVRTAALQRAAAVLRRRRRP